MLLMLEVGVIGVFLSLDLFLFFLFWEVMLIPMAFLIGIWGHERRIYAAVKFVLYTMAGSILMLVGIIWLYNVTGTFDLPAIQQALQTRRTPRRHRRTDPPQRTAAVPGVLLRLRHQGAALPAAHLAARRARRSAHRRLGDARRRAAEDGHLRHDSLLPAAVPERRARLRRMDRGAGDHRHHLRRAGFARAAQPEEARRLLQRQPPGLRRSRHLRVAQYFAARRGLPDARARHLHRRAVLAGRHALRPPPHLRDHAVRRPGHADAAISRRSSCSSRWPRRACRCSTASSANS